MSMVDLPAEKSKAWYSWAQSVHSSIMSLLSYRQVVVRWDGTAWGTRPSWAASGVIFLSTNDVNAPAPPEASLVIGDIWRRHPDATA